MATKSPFSRSSPLYTRPYAPFPISSPSICARARTSTVSDRSAPPKKNSDRTKHEFPRIRGGKREGTHVFVVKRLGFVELRIVLPRRHLVAASVARARAPAAAAGARADQQSPAASRAPGGGHSACSRVWVGRELEDEGSRKTKAEGRERGERQCRCFSVIIGNYFLSGFDFFFLWAWETNGMDPILYRGWALGVGGSQRGCCRDKRGQRLSISCHQL